MASSTSSQRMRKIPTENCRLSAEERQTRDLQHRALEEQTERALIIGFMGKVLSAATSLIQMLRILMSGKWGNSASAPTGTQPAEILFPSRATCTKGAMERGSPYLPIPHQRPWSSTIHIIHPVSYTHLTLPTI